MARRCLAATVACMVSVLMVPSLWAQGGYGVPQRTDDNLIVASYNIKWLGQTPHEFDKLAQVIENFDVCGIVEVERESAVRLLVAALEQRTGKDWGYVYGVRTHRPHGTYYEAYAAVWRRDRVELGDGILSNVWDLQEVYRNDPYLVSFKRKGFDFTLLLVHTRWSDDLEGSRANEVATIPEQLLWLKSFLDERDFIVAGDFNYSGDAAEMKDMADASGLARVDPNVPSTFKGDGSGYASAYDHIYLSPDDTTEFGGQCAVLDVTPLVYGQATTTTRKAARNALSDHLPVWAAFDVTDADDD
jgi:endonuclease/exonuclease/phosphatase family metal-dependent hydrolase